MTGVALYNSARCGDSTWRCMDTAEAIADTADATDAPPEPRRDEKLHDGFRRSRSSPLYSENAG